MYKSLLFIFTVITAVLMFGCAKPETTTNRNAAPATTAPASSPATSPATTTASDSTAIGVAECDAFIASYEACVRDKVPAAARAQYNAGLAQWRKSWHDLAQNPTTKATLASVCKTQLDTTKQAMKSFGCTF